MLITFSIANFRSFAQEETFSMVASQRLSEHPTHLCAIPNSEEKALKTAVMYGANGAGKSNLFKAFAALKNIVLQPRKKGGGVARQPFRLGHIAQEATSFDVQFVAEQQMYRYICKFDDHYILEEALLKISGDSEEPIFERVTSEQGSVRIEVNPQQVAKVLAMAAIGGPANQTFLATIIAMLEVNELGAEFQAVLKWFHVGLKLISPQSIFAELPVHLSEQQDFRDFAGYFLSGAATGVAKIESNKIEISEEELAARYGSELIEKVKESMQGDDEGYERIDFGNGEVVYFDPGDGGHWYRFHLSTSHQQGDGTSISLELKEESDGTRRLLDLIPALHDLRNNEVTYVIDEFDRSLHPMLVHKFVEFFLQACTSAHRQIIITTHESSLLDLDLLRRDEIWFAEKDQTGASHLYSLADFKVRKDLEIRKGYLQGRFGAIPFLGNLDRLLQKEDAAWA